MQIFIEKDSVDVRAPESMELSKIKDVLKAKISWIFKQQLLLKERKPGIKITKKSFVYLGKPVPYSIKSSQKSEKITYAKNAETIELLEKETYATKRGTASRYYEEGGVGYAFMDKEIPTHSLTMYRIKVLTGEAAGKEGWIYKSSLGPRTRKPQRQNKSESMSKTGNFIVRLKSGKIIVSPLYQEEDGVVTIKKAGKIVSYPKSEILSIKNLGG